MEQNKGRGIFSPWVLRCSQGFGKVYLANPPPQHQLLGRTGVDAPGLQLTAGKLSLPAPTKPLPVLPGLCVLGPVRLVLEHVQERVRYL